MAKKDSSIVTVKSLIDLGGNRFRLRTTASDIHLSSRPGQFFNIGQPDNSPYLPRPFSVYEIYPEDKEMDFLIVAVGKGTNKLQSCQPGDRLRLIGPLGNGFPFEPEKPHHVYVAGSIGLAPFIELYRELQKANPKAKHTLIYGCRSKAELVDCDFLNAMDWDVHEVTDDGSRGHKGFVTDVLKDLSFPEGTTYYTCGPTPMMKAVHDVLKNRDEECWVSMEEHMACGIGICKGCVVFREDLPPPMDTICKTGPVFSGSVIFPEQ